MDPPPDPGRANDAHDPASFLNGRKEALNGSDPRRRLALSSAGVDIALRGAIPIQSITAAKLRNAHFGDMSCSSIRIGYTYRRVLKTYQ